MDSRAALLKGGDTGPAVVPGKPSDSLLIQAVLHAKADLEMPPKEKLTTNDIAVLEHWIRQGAPWPDVKVLAPISAARAGEKLGDAWTDLRNPIVKIFGGQRLDLWSLQPVARHRPPVTRNRPWVRNPIDAFVLARLEAAGLKPSPEADRRTLARRLYFDLIGLPPTPTEMDEFIRDRSRDAYERLVDRLLASPRYGEHAARQWLDVIRYSDSNGFDWDEYRPRSWKFRDYVIRSFNADKPISQFIREQLAGDELLPGPPESTADQDLLVATGYLRLGPHDNSAPSFNEQDRSRSELLTDLTETTGSAFLGLTMSCCRCHDHKYDPLSQADHYRLRAFFEPVKFADDLPLDFAAEQETIRKQNDAVEQKIKPVKEERDALLAAVKKRLREERIAKLSASDRAVLEAPIEKRTNDLKDKVEALEKKITPSDKELMAGLGKDEKAKHDLLSKDLDAFKKEKRSFNLGLLMTDGDTRPLTTRVLFQGNHKDPRETVEPGFISALDPNPAVLRTAANRKTTGRRLTLAEWIVATNNPLTSRVFVNRVWQTHFGHGLVATPNDFGLAGARPTHPELLDWLAAEFMRQGWSLKKLHRLMVTSATYRQSSSSPAGAGTALLKVSSRKGKLSAPGSPLQIDAENHLLWRQNLRRLSAEQLRDALLAVSGSLTNRDGGPPVWPALPAEILQANPAFLDDNPEKTKGWYPSPGAEQNVRSIYLVQKKTVRIPFLETFDLPENSISCARRNESTVAPQALSLLNSSLAIEVARALATRIEKNAGTNPDACIDALFAMALQRPPAADERQAARSLLKDRSLTELCRALLNVNEFVYLD